MIPIGLSVSDLSLAVKVIYNVCGAFRDANGADQQYAATVTFLDAFARTFERMIEYTRSITEQQGSLSPSSKSTATNTANAPGSGSNGDKVALSDDLTAQMRLIYAEYTKFDDYLKKFEPGLSSKSATSRFSARAKWAIRELSEKVDTLKKDVIAPMMLVTPLLAVEVLRELKEIRAQLPQTESYEAAIRQNSKLILQTNSDIAHLRANIGSWWWNRRWAMTAIEEDIKTLKVVVKSNTDLIESSRAAVQASVSEATQKQAASNVETITVLETVMAGRLNSIESQIDQLICDNRLKTGKDDRELASIKLRLATSRSHLQKASRSARQCLNQFGLLVIAVEDVHSSIVPGGMLPFAKALVGYNRIFEAGQKFVKYGGQTIESGGKWGQDSDVFGGLRSWNPFAGVADAAEVRKTGGERTELDGGWASMPHAGKETETEKKEPSSTARDTKVPPPHQFEQRHRAPTMQDEGYDSGDEPSRRSTPALTSMSIPKLPPPPSYIETHPHQKQQQYRPPPHQYSDDLLDLRDFDKGEEPVLAANTVATRGSPQDHHYHHHANHEDTTTTTAGLDDNPWA